MREEDLAFFHASRIRHDASRVTHPEVVAGAGAPDRPYAGSRAFRRKPFLALGNPILPSLSTTRALDHDLTHDDSAPTRLAL